jgi:integrase/recombinase XerD
MLGAGTTPVVMMMLRLGLRAAEVANLDVEHIDWRQGEIIISGKGHRPDRLPVPAEVGRAVAKHGHCLGRHW